MPHTPWTFDNMWPADVPVMEEEHIRDFVNEKYKTTTGKILDYPYDLVYETFPNVVAQSIVLAALRIASFHRRGRGPKNRHADEADAWNDVMESLGYTKDVIEPEWPDSVPVLNENHNRHVVSQAIAQTFADHRAVSIAWDTHFKYLREIRKRRVNYLPPGEEPEGEAFNLAMEELGYTEWIV